MSLPYQSTAPAYTIQPTPEREAIPLAFEVATEDAIQKYDYVLTTHGQAGYITHIKTVNGMTGYSILQVYRTSSGYPIIPRNASRLWAWEYEIAMVLS